MSTTMKAVLASLVVASVMLGNVAKPAKTGREVAAECK